ncbi:endospore germination permease [Metabacillus fastidiosus]|uniref:GerAB/ArcD/ProY family transporter n=1 Tax=Metabacillus fastidiosus TaxID=1458 RepID=UPI002DB75E2A|nr:endospore germination permease [Metabacillus fastidiosus]MEC2078544.1 endospore germination permease [Metabacillus fastidiosus]
MSNQQKINGVQLSAIVILYIIGTSILLAPSILVSLAKQDAWIAAIIGVGVALLFILPLYNALGNLYPNMTLVEYSEKILGKWIGKAASFFFFTYLMILCALVLRNIGDFMATQILSETPSLAIYVFFVSIVIMGTRLGLEPVARAAEIFIPWVILLFFFFMIFITPQAKIDNIQPVLGNGIIPILKASGPFIVFPFLELIVFLMIFPSLNRSQDFKKAASIGILAGGIIIVITVTLSILVLGSDITRSQIYPTYSLARKINIGDFLTRIEVIVATIWFFSIYIKLTVCFYGAALSLSQTLNLREYRMLTYPLGIILIILSIIISPDIVYELIEIPKTMRLYTLTFGLFFPLLLITVSFIRKKLKKN